MPGRHINDQQVRLYMRLRADHTQITSAAKAGLSVATGRRTENDPRPPSSKRQRRVYRTRADPLAGLWDEEVVPMLRAAPGLRPISLFDELARRRPERVGPSFRRTLERRVAEWKALIIGLLRARELAIEELDVRMDSELVVRQVTGIYRVKHADLIPLASQAKALLRGFEAVDVRHVPRKENAKADAVVNAVLDRAAASRAGLSG